jgi:hypothetical protein
MIPTPLDNARACGRDPSPRWGHRQIRHPRGRACAKLASDVSMHPTKGGRIGSQPYRFRRADRQTTHGHRSSGIFAECARVSYEISHPVSSASEMDDATVGGFPVGVARRHGFDLAALGALRPLRPAEGSGRRERDGLLAARTSSAGARDLRPAVAPARGSRPDIGWLPSDCTRYVER